MSWNPVNDAKKWIKRLESGGKDAVNKVKNEASGKVSWIKREGQSAVNKIGDEADKKAGWIEEKGKKVGGLVEEAGKKAIEEIEDTVEERVPELLEQFLKDLAGALTKEGIKKIRNLARRGHKQMGELAKRKGDLVGAINSLSFYVELGPVKLVYSDFYARAEQLVGVLDSYVNEPPQFRRGPLLDFMRATGPTSVNTGLSVQVVALVVGSKELGIGGGLNDIDPELAMELLDVILEEMGVPE